MQGSIKNRQVHPDLVKAREACDFDQKELVTFIAGGEEN